MRILIASDPGHNSYVGSLVCALNDLSTVTSVMSGAVLFWMQPRNIDVLHIQWPEVLFPGGRDPSEADLERLERQLTLWKGCTRIVATVHNRIPHFSRTDRARRLFATVYRHCDGIIHLGARSMDAIQEDFRTSSHLQQRVIPLGNYAYFENTVSVSEARRWLGIEADRLLVLAFGNLRHKEELRLLLQGYRRFQARKKTLLVAGRVSWPPYRLVKLYKRLQRVMNLPVVIRNEFIPDTEVQHYLNAADILVIPRFDQLNSGNVALGFTFGKVVVGPRTGVMGELLQKYDNPTYVPGDAQSLVEALGDAVRLLGTDRPADNRRVALEEWSWPRIAAAHLDFYQKLGIPVSA